MIVRHNNLIETEDESSCNIRKNSRTNIRENSEKSRSSRSRENSPFISSEERTSMTNAQTSLITAKDIIGTIKVLNGKDDCSVEDFIKIVKKAHSSTGAAAKWIYCWISSSHRSGKTRDKVHTDRGLGRSLS